MSERGGAATQAGILLQNSLAALYLGRMCDPLERSPSDSVTAVRVESPDAVDDTVVTFADGHRNFIQSKERITSGSPEWTKLWQAFITQYQDGTFRQRVDRLMLHVGTDSKFAQCLEELCGRAAASDTYIEWIKRLNDDHRKLFTKLRGEFDSLADESEMHHFMGHIDIVRWPLSRIQSDHVPFWMPHSSVAPTTLFGLLRDFVGNCARAKVNIDVAKLRNYLTSDHKIELYRWPYTDTTLLPFPQEPLCIGRANIVSKVARRILAVSPLPVPILGPPGVGKSTVALSVAHRRDVSDSVRQRRCFILCQMASTAEALGGLIAQGLGLKLGELPLMRVLQALDAQPVLLILDNLETPWEEHTNATELLLRDLAGVGNARLIFTMRGEQCPKIVRCGPAVRVRPLSLSEARKVFLSIAGPSFKNDRYLDDLLRAVGQNALAVSLLGHLAEAEPNLDGLSRTWRDQLLSVDSSLTTSINLSVSCRRMTRVPAARRLLSILALLPGGIAWKHLDTVMPEDAQIAASTLRKVGLAYDVGGRLEVLSPVRDYVRLHVALDASDRQRVTNFYVGMVANLSTARDEGWTEDDDLHISSYVANAEAAAISTANHSPSSSIQLLYGLSERQRSLGLGSPNMLRSIARTITDVNVLNDLENDDRWREAAEKMVQAGMTYIGELEKLARDGNSIVRRRARSVLSAISPETVRVGNAQGAVGQDFSTSGEEIKGTA